MSIDQFFTRSPLSFHRVAQPRRERGAGGVGGDRFFFFFFLFFRRGQLCSVTADRGGLGMAGNGC